MYVPGCYNFALKNTQRVDFVGTLQNHKNSRDYLNYAKKLNYGTKLRNARWVARRGRGVSNAHARTWTQSDMEEFDPITYDKRNYVASYTEWCNYRDRKQCGTTLLRRRQRHRRDRMTPWIETTCTVEKGTHDPTILSSRCWGVVIVVFMDMVAFVKVFMLGFFVVANMATTTTNNHSWRPSTRLEHKEEGKLRATCCCDTNQTAWMSSLIFFDLTIGEWQSERVVYTHTHSHANFFSFAALRRTFDALCTLHFYGWGSDWKSRSIKSSDADLLCLSATVPRSDTLATCLACFHICSITLAFVWQYDVTPIKHSFDMGEPFYFLPPSWILRSGSARRSVDDHRLLSSSL